MRGLSGSSLSAVEVPSTPRSWARHRGSSSPGASRQGALPPQCHRPAPDSAYVWVDLLEEDVRDTMVLSRILRAGQWEYVAAKNGGTATVEKHNIRDVLVREIGEEIDKETDHRWDQPLTEERLRYASDDVEASPTSLPRPLEKVKKDGMLDAYKLIHKVYPLYMRQQVRESAV